VGRCIIEKNCRIYYNCETEEFYRELQQNIYKIPKKENIILAGDFNGRIGNQPIPECIGTYGEQVMNYNGAALRDFCAFNKLKITNSFYRHKDIRSASRK
jgi:hypothetical protein